MELPVCTPEELAGDLMTLLSEGTDVQLSGFGTFTVRVYEAYEGRNPRTGEAVQVSEKRLLSFRPDRRVLDDIESSAFTTSCEALASRTSKRLGLSKEDVSRVLNEWLAGVLGRLREGPVVFAHLGVFRIARTPERQGRNSQTGELITIPARTVLSFLPSRRSRNRLKGVSDIPRVESRVVDEAISRFIKGAVLSSKEVEQRMSALALKRPGSENATALVEKAMGRAMPPAFCCAFSYDLSEIGRRSISTLNTQELFTAAFEGLHGPNYGAEVVVPFAEGAELWCFCSHPTPESEDAWVFPISHHSHDLPFSRWLAVTVFIWELTAGASDGSLLTSADTQRVLVSISQVTSEAAFHGAIPF